jgi:hypothetical protein
VIDLEGRTLEAIDGGNAEPGRCVGIALKWGDFVLCLGDSTFP